MEFAEFGPVVAIRHEAAGYFLEEPTEISRYEKIFSSLSGVALDQTETKAVINRMAIDLYGQGRSG